MEKAIVGITLGDASGIGPEIVAKLCVKGYFTQYFRPIMIGDVRVFEDGLRIIGAEYPHYVIKDVDEANWSKGQPILDLGDQDPALVTMGKTSAYCGIGDVDQIVKACELCKEGKIAGFLYAPLHKGNMKDSGMKFESEGELMAHCFGVKGLYGEINVLENIQTVRVTSHIPLKDVSANLSKERILECIRLAHDTCKGSGIAEPRVAVSGLNPHNGENGKCGTEEIDIIIPAVEAARAEGMNVEGPFSADVVFMRAFRGDFDTVVTMYHDQGQIALKLRGFEGVTVGGGQPYPIVTPAHGTAYGKAGKGTAATKAIENATDLLYKMVSH